MIVANSPKMTGMPKRVLRTAGVTFGLCIAMVPLVYYLTYRQILFHSPAFVRNHSSPSTVDRNSRNIQGHAEALTNSPVLHIGYIKVHKSASSTLQNIFYRFGYSRNLSFLVPANRYELSISERKGEISRILPADTGNNVYDILANHAFYDPEILTGFLHNDTKWIGIMRDPSENFVSAVMYYKNMFTSAPDTQYIRDIPNDRLLHELISNPTDHEPTDLRRSFTYNRQANDLGFTLETIERVPDYVILQYLNKLDNEFLFILITEYFDESLVLMKRYLNWTLRDVLYVRSNVATGYQKPCLTYQDELKLRDRNYVDYVFYDFFVKRFWSQMLLEGPSIFDEILHFKKVRQHVENFCVGKYRVSDDSDDVIKILHSKWNSEFTIDMQECNMILMKEWPFYKMIHARQRQTV